MNTLNEHFMNIALEEAKKVTVDVPVGAVIVKDNKIIAKAHNLKEKNNDCTHHAEILAIQEASKKLNTWRLEGCSLYVTLEPCPMCASAILYSRHSNVYFGAYDNLYGAFGSVINMVEIIKFSPKIMGGIKEVECSNILSEFFKSIRK